jgi:hypothetical protein
MALYRISRKDPYERAFYIGFAVVIILLLGLCFVSLRYGENYDELIGHRFASIAFGIVVVSIVFFVFLDTMQQGISRWKRGYTIELSQGKLIQRITGEEAVEIAVGEIKSLREERGLLIVEDGEKSITIPAEVRDFSSLKHELSAHRPITPLNKAESSPLFLRTGLAIAVWVLLVLLFSSYRRVHPATASFTFLPALVLLLLLCSRIKRLSAVIILYLITITLIVAWWFVSPRVPAIF